MISRSLTNCIQAEIDRGMCEGLEAGGVGTAVSGPLSASACHASVCAVYHPLQADERPFINQIPESGRQGRSHCCRRISKTVEIHSVSKYLLRSRRAVSTPSWDCNAEVAEGGPLITTEPALTLGCLFFALSPNSFKPNPLDFRPLCQN